MNSPANVATISAVHPATARPRLALILAIAALPGVTIAWQLPMGGLYIGVPLALAALVLGTRARRTLHAGAPGTRLATVAIALATIALAYIPICVAFFA
jgi:hypothetical protein